MPYRKDLTAQERKFVNAYLENNGNSVEAYKTAGYSINGRTNSIEAMACQLLKRPKVATEVHKRLEIIDRASEIKIENKRLALWDIAQDGMQKIPLEVREKQAAMGKMVDSRTSVAAINELNKMDGHHAASKIHLQGEIFSFDIGMAVESQEGVPIEGELADSQDENSPSE